MRKKIKIRWLFKFSSWLFIILGIIILIDGILDSFFLEPEANKFSLSRWEFITLEEWTNFARFEMIYGLSCIILGLYILKFSHKLPIYIIKE
jgi:hypothetical protein